MQIRLILIAFFLIIFSLHAQPEKRVYIACDDHTDYMWHHNEEEYRQAFLEMLDYYLYLADSTRHLPFEYQSRFNCDGSFWIWTYEHNKTEAEFDRLIDHIRSGHISVPLNALISCYGGVPAEAVIRGMYYAGELERKFDLRFPIAVSIENQTMPYGLGAIWAGAGARYSWDGICGCATKIPDAGDREHDIYWWEGADGSRILMKWNSAIHGGNQSLGGYAEAYFTDFVLDYVIHTADFQARYPYPVIGIFGKGWDHLKTFTNDFVRAAQQYSNSSMQVVVSNEQDFFEDFEANYGAEIPVQSCSFGNEWDLYCASLAEVSARVKRALEKLRAAEALASLVKLQQPSFAQNLITARKQAWLNFGLYWEHDWTADGGIRKSERAAWQRKLLKGIEDYIETLFQAAIDQLGALIEKSGSNKRFFVFNPLSWQRSDYADFEFDGPEPIHVIDISTGNEAPLQIVESGNKRFLRIWAEAVPSVGYKVFEIRTGAGISFPVAATYSQNVIENDFYKITFAGNGAITSLIDKKRNNRQLVREIDGRYLNDLGGGSGTIEAENVGPVSVTLKATSSGPLKHTTRLTLFRQSERIDISNEITQNFSDVHTWAYSFNLTLPEVWHEEVGAIIKANLLGQGGHYSPRNARYDWLTMNHFADISEPQIGMTISNADCYFMKLGRSDTTHLDTSTPQISPLVGGQVDGPSLGIDKQGGDTYFLQRFALKSHNQFQPAEAMRFALEHQNPFVTAEVKGGSIYPQDSFCLLEIDNPEVLLWAFKPTEDSSNDRFVVRVWNASFNGKNFNLKIHHHTASDAIKVTHIETPLESIPIFSNTITYGLNSQQMASFSIAMSPTSGISPRKSSQMPPDFRLLQNYPNPFNSETAIRFQLSKAGMVTIDIYNIAGQKMFTILNSDQPAGNHAVIWNSGSLPSGVYFYRMRVDNFTDMKKCVVLR